MYAAFFILNLVFRFVENGPGFPNRRARTAIARVRSALMAPSAKE